MVYILNEDTQPVIRTIGVSYTDCKYRMSFDKIFDLTAGWSAFSFFIIKEESIISAVIGNFTGTWAQGINRGRNMITENPAALRGGSKGCRDPTTKKHEEKGRMAAISVVLRVCKVTGALLGKVRRKSGQS